MHACEAHLLRFGETQEKIFLRQTKGEGTEASRRDESTSCVQSGWSAEAHRQEETVQSGPFQYVRAQKQLPAGKK